MHFAVWFTSNFIFVLFHIHKVYSFLKVVLKCHPQEVIGEELIADDSCQSHKAHSKTFVVINPRLATVCIGSLRFDHYRFRLTLS